ncbi:MAG: ATP-binding protein [Endomicrobiaceae bacterium]|nr:ATP-binding protein [Endomicrobiaceae bacterium]
MKKRVSFSLGFKFTIVISVVIILTSVILTWFFVKGQTLLLKSFVENRAVILAHSLATSSEYGVLAQSREFLSHLTKITIKEEDVLYALIYDDKGDVLSDTSVSDSSIYNYLNDVDKKQFDFVSLKETGTKKNVVFISNVGEIIEVVVPILSYDSTTGVNLGDNANVVGVVRVGLTLERIKYQIKEITKNILFLTMVVIFAGIIISSFLIKILIKPIDYLMVGTNKIANGDLTYRIPLISRDEFRNLSISFNSMASDIEVKIKELNKEKKELLNLKVAFEERSQELEETLDKVQSIQQDLIRSEKFATVGRLASSVAHELRNPLASIKNISYFLSKLGAFSDDKSKQMVEMLSSEVQRANKIITELLDYSKTRKLSKFDIDIDSFIEKSIQTVGLSENVKLVLNLESFKAMIDADRITQVLVNLISNAKDAMPQSGGIITVTSKKIDDDSFVITVEDNACGIDPESLKRIFEPLFTTKLKGIGLGLPIVKEIIDAHNGQITVESTMNVGTIFTIKLPIN